MFEREPGHSPERELWQVVLMTAIDDAVSGVPATSCPNPARRVRMTIEARAYITTPSRDLSMVCTLAGLDPAAVLDRMRARIAAAPSIEELFSADAIAEFRRIEEEAEAKRLERLEAQAMRREREASRTAARDEAQARRDRKNERRREKRAEAKAQRDREKAEAQEAPDPRLAHLRAERDRRGHTSGRSGTGAMLTHNGMTLSISEWTEITGLGNATIRKRLKDGMSHAEALRPPKGALHEVAAEFTKS